MDLNVFFNDPAGLAVKGMLIAAGLDFLFGVYASAKDGSFALDAVAAFVRKHVLGRVLPISTLLVAGYASGDTFMTTAGAAAATAYGAETLASIYGSIKPPAESAQKVDAAIAAGNPIPDA